MSSPFNHRSQRESSKAVPVTPADLQVFIAKLARRADLSTSPPPNYTPTNISTFIGNAQYALFQIQVNIPKRATKQLNRYSWALRNLAHISIEEITAGPDASNYARWTVHARNVEDLTDAIMVIAIARLGGSALCIGQAQTISIRLFISPRFAVRVIGVGGQTILLCRKELQTMMFVAAQDEVDGKILCIVSKERGLAAIRSTLKVISLAYNSVCESGPCPDEALQSLSAAEALVYRTLCLSRIDQESTRASNPAPSVAVTRPSNPHVQAAQQCNMWPNQYPFISNCTDTPYPEYPAYFPPHLIKANEYYSVPSPHDDDVSGHGLFPRKLKPEPKRGPSDDQQCSSSASSDHKVEPPVHHKLPPVMYMGHEVLAPEWTNWTPTMMHMHSGISAESTKRLMAAGNIVNYGRPHVRSNSITLSMMPHLTTTEVYNYQASQGQQWPYPAENFRDAAWLGR